MLRYHETTAELALQAARVTRAPMPAAVLPCEAAFVEQGFGSRAQGSAQAVARRMVQRERGTILFTGATAGTRGAAGFAAFAGAKHGLRALAHAPDGQIEAFEVLGARTFAYAVQFHPEWRCWETPFYAAIFEAFGRACRQRMNLRLQAADLARA